MGAGRTFVVTGAGTGIGRAIAQRLASDGARVALMARDASRLTETADAIREAGGEASVHACDIRDGAQVDAAFDAAAAALGPFTGLVANAGIGGENLPGPEDRFFDIVETNLVGTYRCLRATQRHLAAGPEARHLVVISSILARIGVPAYTGYCASKTALLGLTRSMAMELAGDNVQVNAICPGWVNTAMARQGIQGFADAQGISFEEARAGAMSAVPFGRMSEPEHIAGMVSWLVGPDGVGVTGQALDMNNGAFMI